MVRLLVAACCFLAGCADKGPMQSGPHKLRCNPCQMVIYEGPINHYRNGFQWPAGEMKHCCSGECMCKDLPEQWWECPKCNPGGPPYKVRENTWDGTCPDGHKLELRPAHKGNPS